MKILIITTWFAPDTGIAAVRPYEFAKFLSYSGHEVTVLRSGEVCKNIDKDFYHEPWSFRVIDANRESADFSAENSFAKKRKLDYLPEKAREHIVSIYRTLMLPFDIALVYKKLALQKCAINHMIVENKEYDVIFSTYGNLENVFSGRYAAKHFGCKLIQDFRDSIVEYHKRNFLWNIIMRPVEKSAICKADLCIGVAYGLTNHLLHYRTKTKCVTLHNGYAKSEHTEVPEFPKEFTICYTGSVYSDQRKVAKVLFCAIKDLVENGSIDANNIKFQYAGSVGKIWTEILNELELLEIYQDCGYLKKLDVELLQQRADLFLVLSWNFKKCQGVISGKFYEGIRSKKPILSVVGGDLPNSELYQMNEKYHYGYCFEEARGQEEVEELKQYILDAYNQKMETGKVDYHQNPQLEEDFCYENLAKKLESLCYELIGEKQAQKEAKT